MNVEAIQKKLEEYYSKATPLQILKEFEGLGVEFVVIPEVQQVRFDFNIESSLEFNNDSHLWLDDFLVKWPEPNYFSPYSGLPVKSVTSKPDDASQEKIPNYQYAMAA